MIEIRRDCTHCGYVHTFVDDADDRDECPRCGQGLYPVAKIITDRHRFEEMLERELLDGLALSIWQRIDDVRPGDPPHIRDIVQQLSMRLLSDGQMKVLGTAREWAMARRSARRALDERVRLLAKHGCPTDHGAYNAIFGCVDKAISDAECEESRLLGRLNWYADELIGESEAST